MKSKDRITITIDRELLADAESAAGSLNMTRSAAISFLLRLGLHTLQAMLEGGVDHGSVKIY